MTVEVCPICDIAGCKHIRERTHPMTHDTPPKRMVDLISREAALAIIDPGDGDFHAGNYNGIAALPTVTGYTLTSEAEAMVAAALREAAEGLLDWYTNVEDDRGPHMVVRALIPQPASAALDKLIAEAEARGVERAAQWHDDQITQMQLGADMTSKHLDEAIADHQEAAAAIRAAKGDPT